MSVVTAVTAGVLIGVRHSFEADHIAAVAALIDDHGMDRAGLVGVLWGVGHGLPIAALGVVFLLAGTQFPAWVSSAFEVLAGIILVYLGVRLLYANIDLVTHDHDGETHTHAHLGSTLLGLGHSHREGESFGVGVVHGLAGTGAFIVLIVATAPTITTGLSFLGAFTAASVATMGVLAFCWGRLLSRTFTRALQIAAGIASLAVGTLLLLGEVTGTGPLGHDHGHDHARHAHDHAAVALEVTWAVTDLITSLPPLG